jgi:hypothetical protein
MTTPRRPEVVVVTGDAIPPLEPGDRLSRAEFERRYAAMPHVNKAELIEGVVYMPSPVRTGQHGHPHFRLIGWLNLYTSATPSVIGCDNATVRLDQDNEPQPDVFLLIDPARGGQARIGPDDYIEGAPEFVAEVSGTSVSFDMHTKLNVYRRSGVREYLVWRVADQAIDWFALRGGQYQPMPPHDSGIVRSEVFPGLWLDTAAMIRGDMARVLAVVQDGIASDEHKAFVAKLATPSA